SSIARIRSAFLTGSPPAVFHPRRFQPASHSLEHLIAYCESDSIISGCAPGCAVIASSIARNSAIWLVPLGAPPECDPPSWFTHAQPIAPPGFFRHEPSVLTMITRPSLRWARAPRPAARAADQRDLRHSLRAVPHADHSGAAGESIV